MILKPTDENRNIVELERLKALYPDREEQISQELRKIRAGHKEEQNVAHYLDRDLGSTDYSVVLHDLRLEYRGQVVQLDHLIINRALIFTILETKSAKYGLKVDEKGNFSRLFNGKYTNFASPIEQVNSQARMLDEYVNGYGLLPKRLGMKLKPFVQGFVTISPTVNFECSPSFDARQVIRYDRVLKEMENAPAKFNLFGRLASFVNYETLEEIGQTLIRHHVPKDVDWVGRLRLGKPKTEVVAEKAETEGQRAAPEAPQIATVNETTPAPATVHAEAAPSEKPAEHVCKHCGSSKLEMKYGRSYYFYCGDCEKNTAAKLPGPGRIRKEGNNFFYVEASKPEALYFTNK